MSYKVVCIKEFVGLDSSGKFVNIPMPVLDAIYTCIDENIDGFGTHSLILKELNHKGGYNSDYFAPIDGIGDKSNKVEQPMEQVI